MEILESAAGDGRKTQVSIKQDNPVPALLQIALICDVKGKKGDGDALYSE